MFTAPFVGRILWQSLFALCTSVVIEAMVKRARLYFCYLLLSAKEGYTKQNTYIPVERMLIVIVSHSFLPRDALVHSAVMRLLSSVRLSVCLSVCLSVRL